MKISLNLRSIIRRINPNFFPHTIEKCAIAHHEAGHAVARYCLNLPMSIVSIIQQEDCRGYIDYPDNWGKEFFKLREGESHQDRAKRLEEFGFSADVEKLCGGIAEAKYLNRPIFDGMRSDIANVKLALILQKYIKKMDDNEVESYLEDRLKLANQLMEDSTNWQAVKLLAKALLENEEITGQEASGIISTVLK